MRSLRGVGVAGRLHTFSAAGNSLQDTAGLGQQGMDRIAAMQKKKPWVAAIDGACLGGGLELAQRAGSDVAAHDAAWRRAEQALQQPDVSACADAAQDVANAAADRPPVRCSATRPPPRADPSSATFPLG